MKIFITGASDGIGKELVYQYAKSENILGLCGRDQSKLLQVQKICKMKGAVCYIYNFNLKSDIAVFSKVATDFLDKANGIDLLIANAGMGSSQYEKNSTDYLLNFMDINLSGTIKTINAFLPHMIEKNHGHIAYVSSIYAFRNAHIYATSKIAANAYIDMLTKAVPQLKYTTIYPGFVQTEMIKHVKNPPFVITPNKAAMMIYDAITLQKRYAILSKRLFLLTVLLNFKWIRKLIERFKK